MSRMEALIGGLGAFAIVIATGCTAPQDQGNLMIRCPDAKGGVALAGGQVTIDGMVLRIAADLKAPLSSVDEEGMTVAIEVQGPPLGSNDRSPSVDCVRVARPDRGEQWDTVPRRVEESRDTTKTRVLATARDGPYWKAGDQVEVTVWLRTTEARTGAWHVLTLSRQQMHP